MEDEFGNTEPDTTGAGLGEYDNGFERVDADERPVGSEYPEEDDYGASPVQDDPYDQPESSQFPADEPSSTVPTDDLLTFGGGDPEIEEQGAPEDDIVPPAQPQDSSHGLDDLLGGFAPAPTSTSTEPESLSGGGDLLQTEPESPPESSLLPEEPPAPAEPEKEVEKPTLPTEPIISEAAPSTPAKSIEFLKNLHPQVVELLYWRDVKQSGVVFAGGLLLLLALSTFSIISVVAYFLLALLTVTIGFRVYKTVMAAVNKSDESHPFKPIMDQDLTISDEQVSKYTSKAVAHINEDIAKLRHYLLVEDILDSVKFAVFLYLLTYLGSWFNGLTLVIIAYLLVFAVPIVYEKYQKEIDENINKVNAQVETQLAMIKEKIPWLKKKEE